MHSAAGKWLVCLCSLLLGISSATAAFAGTFTGAVTYFPHAACEAVLITLQLENSALITAGTEFIVQTPGLTSGTCAGTAGVDLDVGTLLLSNAAWSAGFVEGQADDMFRDSYLKLVPTTAVAAGAFTIRLDPSNGIKITCYSESTLDMYDASAPLTTWPLSIKPFGGCPMYNSRLTFFPGLQFQPTEINVTLSLGLEISFGDQIFVNLPHFTSGPAFGGDGFSIPELTGALVYVNATWSQEPGGGIPQLIITRNAFAPIPSATRFTVVLSRMNGIKPLRNSWTGDEQFSFSADSAVGSISAPFLVVDSVGNGCEGMRDCSGHGVCDLETNLCICQIGYGAPTDVFGEDLPVDCSGRVCPSGIAGFGTVPTGPQTGHPIRECSNNGACDRQSGRCKCFAPFTGQACEIMRCPRDCSGRGLCLTMRQLADYPSATPLRDADATITYLSEVDGPTWDADVVTGCVCDSTWPVGLGAGETQTAEFFGADCSLRHCPSGDDPETFHDETNCTNVVAEGGQGVGKPGNICHVDCSNRGICNFMTGTCSCFAGYWGENCGLKDIHAAGQTKTKSKTSK